MAEFESSTASFLEVHYYSSGLRQHSVSLTGKRPNWAPDADAVGFRNEFALIEGDAVIEFQRLVHQGSRITWLAIYGPSTDEKLGNRANHSGVGLWLRDLTVVDARSVILALNELKDILGTPFNPVKFDDQAALFLSDWLPKYIELFKVYVPGFAGVRFSDVPLLATKIYGIVKAPHPDAYDLAADLLMNLSFHPESVTKPARSLIHISDSEHLLSLGAKKEILSPNSNFFSGFISVIPSVIASSSTTLNDLAENNAKLEKKNLDNIGQNRELIKNYNNVVKERDDLRKLVNNLEREKPLAPISRDLDNVLTALARIDRRIDGLQHPAEYTTRDAAPLFYTLLGSFGFALLALIFWSIAYFGPPILAFFAEPFSIR